jgi:hypothetical protein
MELLRAYGLAQPWINGDLNKEQQAIAVDIVIDALAHTK